jgi:hypothetical protein
MTKDKQIEEMEFSDVDILANDINQHCADLAETYCGDTNCLTCLAHALTEKGYRKASDVAREIFAEIEDVLNNIGYFDEIDFNALQKKYDSEVNKG